MRIGFVYDHIHSVYESNPTRLTRVPTAGGDKPRPHDAHYSGNDTKTVNGERITPKWVKTVVALLKTSYRTTKASRQMSFVIRLSNEKPEISRGHVQRDVS